MRESSTTIPKASTTRKRRVAGPSRVARRSGVVRSVKTGGKSRPRETEPALAYVVDNGEPTHVLVPIDEYERLIKIDMVQDTVAQIERGDDDFVDAGEFALELAAERIAAARKAKGLTQKQLGERLNLPQSQISRIERNPDRSTVRTLKRIARALGVDVGVLISTK